MRYARRGTFSLGKRLAFGFLTRLFFTLTAKNKSKSNGRSCPDYLDLSHFVFLFMLAGAMKSLTEIYLL